MGGKGESGWILRLKGAGILNRFDQRDGTLGQLTHGPDHFGMSGMADQNYFAASLKMTFRLDMDLGDERAGGVQIEHLAVLSVGRDRFGHPVSGEYHRPILRAFVQFFDENRAHGP